jgi:hypothetical protein
MRTLSLVVLVLFVMGCSPPPQNQKRTTQQPQSQSADIINTMSQRNSLDAGRRTAEKAREISAQRSRDLREVGGE